MREIYLENGLIYFTAIGLVIKKTNWPMWIPSLPRHI